MEKKKRTLDDIIKFYDVQKSIYALFDDFTTVTSDTRYKAVKETKGKK